MRTGSKVSQPRPQSGRTGHQSSEQSDAAVSSDYYAAHYRAYHAETFHIDPSPFLGPFARRLRPGSRVLDVGCGSGRDLVWLQRQGFRTVGLERSTGLAGLARQRAGCEVIVGDFGKFDFATLSVDALVLSGALVHLPHDEMPAVLGRILPALDRRGRNPVQGPRDARVYVSLKEGHGRFEDPRGRIFYLWSDETLRRIFKALALSVDHFSRGTSADGSGSVWLGYVLTKLFSAPAAVNPARR